LRHGAGRPRLLRISAALLAAKWIAYGDEDPKVDRADLLADYPVATHLASRSVRSNPSAPPLDKLAVRYEATLHVVAINEWR
jgi:hypothetical protein